MNIILKRMLLLILIILTISQLFAQEIELSRPEDVGLSTERLLKIRPVMQRYIDDGILPGMITMVVRRGKIVHFETYGMQNIETEKPMTKSSIFRIHSMTKPITSTAIMMLYEEGRFQLSDPVSKYIPEFKNLMVYTGGSMKNLKLVKQEREMTIHDLLRHTAGLTYTWGHTTVDSLYRQKNVLDKKNDTLHDLIIKLKDIPLLYQPGTKYHYSVSIDVLGYLVEVLSGISFDRFLKERIFDPLGMDDTAFYVPADKLNRFVTRYEKKGGVNLTVNDDPQSSLYRIPAKGPSGGGGLVSTVSDYLKFCQMFLNKGELNDKRLLGRQTVEYMMVNHLADEQQVLPGVGFGIGFGIDLNPAKSEILCTPGEISWGGAANTFFWIDPAEDMIYMVWTQLFPWGIYDFRHQFRIMVHAAIID